MGRGVPSEPVIAQLMQSMRLTDTSRSAIKHNSRARLVQDFVRASTHWTRPAFVHATEDVLALRTPSIHRS